MFVKKSQIELKALTEIELDAYVLAKELNDAEILQKAISDAVAPIEVKLTKAEADLVEAGLQIGELKSKGVSNEEVGAFTKEISKNKEILKEIAKGANREELVLKANTVRASIATNAHVNFIDGVGQIQRKRRSLFDYLQKIPVGKGNHNGTISYLDWDEATTVKAAATVAEGAVFPESTAKFKMYPLTLRKIGDTLPVSEEFFEDEVMASAELESFLSTNVEDAVDAQIVNGDNTGENLKGLFASVPAFTPVASGIAQANIYDLGIKVSEAITSIGGNKYQPDMMLMNIADINKLRLTKDTQGRYVFDRQDERIVGLNVIEDNNVPVNTCVVGDSRYAKIYEMGGVVLSQGEVNAQFTSDMKTLKARKRLAFLIRNVDQTGFRKVTSITAALTTLAT